MELWNYVEVSVRHFIVLIFGLFTKKATFSKTRVAYNNVYRKLLGFCRRSSASEMFVTNNISYFEALIRKLSFVFKRVCQISDNTIICTLQSSWVITETIWNVWKDKLYVET